MKRYVFAVLVLFFLMAFGIVLISRGGSDGAKKAEQKAHAEKSSAGAD